MANLAEPLAALTASRPRWVAELADFISIPSVSSDPRRRGDMWRAAKWLQLRLHRLGMSRAALLPTPGNPLVLAEWRQSRRAASVLMYGHYDVVSPEPAHAWRSSPFAAVEREGFLYGRGASDDKGPLVSQLRALEAWLSSTGRLPVNIGCIFEGEEELGSPHLRRLLKSGWRPFPGAKRFDATVVTDTRMLAPGRPALVVALRGSLAAELEVVGPPRDIHSGAFGGAIRNPAHVLAELLASLHDSSGCVSVPGFYQDVRALSSDERDREAADQATASQIFAQMSPQLAFGEPGFSSYQRTAMRPALDVNGIEAGHTGPGGKGIIPARAIAKLSFRLVPDQDPQHVAALLRRHLIARVPPGIALRATFSKPARPVTLDPRSPTLTAARAALRAGFGRTPVVLRSGGTIPVVELLAHCLGAPVMMGFARPDDGMHAPNERVDLGALAAGSRSLVHFLHLMGARTKGSMPLRDTRARAVA